MGRFFARLALAEGFSAGEYQAGAPLGKTRCGSILRDWLSRIDKDAKESRNKRIFDLWMACWTKEEIAQEVGLTHQQVSQITADLPEIAKLPKNDQAAADHATDFDPPIYNIWKRQDRTRGR